jgi:hypothetical protein
MIRTYRLLLGYGVGTGIITISVVFFGGAGQIFRMRYNTSYLSHGLLSFKKYDMNAICRAFATSSGDGTCVSFTAVEFPGLGTNPSSQSDTFRDKEKIKSI